MPHPLISEFLIIYNRAVRASATLRLSGTVPVLQLANNLYSLLVTFTCGICIFKLNSNYIWSIWIVEMLLSKT